jgi:hypothetical protein
MIDTLRCTAQNQTGNPAKPAAARYDQICTNLISMRQNFGGCIAMRHVCLNIFKFDICRNDKGLVDDLLTRLFDLLE